MPSVAKNTQPRAKTCWKVTRALLYNELKVLAETKSVSTSTGSSGDHFVGIYR
jgi:hypothetical protein